MVFERAYCHLAGTAAVHGTVDAGSTGPVRFRDTLAGRVILVNPNPVSGRFRAALPRGEYEVEYAGRRSLLTLLPASATELDLRRDRFFDFSVDHSWDRGQTVEIRVLAKGTGMHRFTIRSQKVRFDRAEREVDLGDGGARTLVWRGDVETDHVPWVAVVLPDEDVTRCREVVGIRKARGPR